MRDNDEDDEPEEPTVKKIDARKGLAQVISFCEQNPTLSTHLDDLWKVMRAMDTYSGCSVQKTLFDFLNTFAAKHPKKSIPQCHACFKDS